MDYDRMNSADFIALILVFIGAINWGLVGINSFTGIDYSFDLVALIFGGIPALAAIIYIIIALAGIWLLSRFLS